MWHNLPIVIKRRVRQKTGHSHSALRKSESGFDFSGVRTYEIGDSPRSISRLRFARTGDALVIEKRPERGAMILMLLDVSASEQLGSAKNKSEAQKEIVRGLARACIAKNCSFAIVAFTTIIEFESGLIRSANTLEGALDELNELNPQERQTDPKEALDYAFAVATRPNSPADLVVLISDFLFPELHDNALESLNDATDVIGIVMRDKIEKSLPPLFGGIVLQDAETGKTIVGSTISDFDPTPDLERRGIDTCTIDTSDDEDGQYQALSDFFTMRLQGK